MDNLQREIEENFRRLAANPYPGRGILVGCSRAGEPVVFYWIMGRSENSRNRVFTKDYGNVRAEPLHPGKVEDPSLVIYRAMGEAKGHYVVSNGAHTESLVEAAEKKGDFHGALAGWSHEPDAPHFTPRIAGGITLKGGHAGGWLAIIKPDPLQPEVSVRRFHDFAALAPGYGWCITTYRGEGTPLPPFVGDPFAVPLQGEGEQLVPWVWQRLNEANRISLALKRIDPATGKSEILLENKYR